VIEKALAWFKKGVAPPNTQGLPIPSSNHRTGKPATVQEVGSDSEVGGCFGEAVTEAWWRPMALYVPPQSHKDGNRFPMAVECRRGCSSEKQMLNNSSDCFACRYRTASVCAVVVLSACALALLTSNRKSQHTALQGAVLPEIVIWSRIYAWSDWLWELPLNRNSGCLFLLPQVVVSSIFPLLLWP